MKRLTAVQGAACAFVVLAIASFYLPRFEAFENVELVLTISTFVFAILAGFFISRLNARYDRVRELVATEDALFLSLYKISAVFGKPFQSRLRDLIDEYYVTALDLTLGDYAYKPTIPVFLAMWDRVTGLKKKSPESAYQVLLTHLSDIENSRNTTSAISTERLAKAEWGMVILLSGIMIICLFQLRSEALTSHILSIFFSILLVLILLIMRELEDLSLGGENLLEESGQEVLEVLGKSRYYNQEFVRTGISKIPSWVKTYRLGLQKPGTLPRTMKLVKRLIVK